MNPVWPQLLFPGFAAVASGGLLAGAFHFARRKRLIDDTPTSKAQGVFMGLVEVKGTAEVETPVVSYLAGARCVHYSWKVEEHWSHTETETYRDSKGHTRTRTRHKSGWKTVAEGGDAVPFYLRDDTGAVLVRPKSASVEGQRVFENTCTPSDPLYYGKGPDMAVVHSDHRRRFIEQAIPLHASLYVMGQAREREDVVAAEIAAAPEAEIFLISTRSEQQISRGMGTGRWVCWVLGGLAAAGAAVLWLKSRELALASRPAAHIATVGGYLAMTALGWLWMAFNSLVNLRQRVRRAWSLVDVELKRRYDLIPNLVAAIEGLKHHEQELQTAAARLRGQLTATPPGQAGADFAGCSASVRSLVERYPELKANGAFLILQKNLIETEQRIALARAFYNDSVTFYNTRIAVVPDALLAKAFGFRPAVLLQAEDFERAPVQVRFAE